MRRKWGPPLAGAAAALGAGLVATALASGQAKAPWAGVLDEHPAIQYASHPTTDRVGTLSRALESGARTLERDAQTGYLRAVLQALDVPAASQILVFSKTGVQRAYTSPRNPRALFFDESVVVGYIPGAPLLELAAHDPQQGIVFYTLDQQAATPAITRRTSCLTCHVSASTLDVPGLIARSNAVDEDGAVIPQLGSNDVDERTPHPDRWGGYFVTSEDAPPPYSDFAHAGNITFTAGGVTSDQVFVDWMSSAPETRGYLSASSDIVSLLAFDHQVRAINLLTRLNWEARVASADGRDPVSDAGVRRLAADLAEYLLFVGEAPVSFPVRAPAALAERFEARAPKDRLGRSCAQLDGSERLLKYPCSYMLYSDAFEGLPPAIRQLVYRRLLAVLSGQDVPRRYDVSPEDRRAVLAILRQTKPDFPKG